MKHVFDVAYGRGKRPPADTGPKKRLEPQYLKTVERWFVDVGGEATEIIPLLSSIYECTSCGGRVVFEDRLVEKYEGMLTCPYCETDNTVLDWA